MSNAQCNNCKFFKNGDAVIGQCLRWPPLGNWPYNNFPMVKSTDWCGEYVVGNINQGEQGYRAIFRTAAAPFPLVATFAAAGRQQIATIFHPATSTRTVAISHIWVAFEDNSTATAILTADLVRLTTAPSGGTIITPTPATSGFTPATTDCSALPSTPGTEGAVFSAQEWILNNTALNNNANPPPAGLNWVDLVGDGESDLLSSSARFPVIRAGVSEGWAVSLQSSRSTAVKLYVMAAFTEQY